MASYLLGFNLSAPRASSDLPGIFCKTTQAKSKVHPVKAYLEVVTGGKPGDTEVEESGPRGKLSRKARIAAKKAQKQARRQHDSDEEDAGVKTGG